MTDLKPMSTLAIWDWLTPEERLAIYTHLLDSRTSSAKDLRQKISQRLAPLVRYRPESFLKNDPRWQLKIFETWKTRKESVRSFLPALLRLYLVEARHDLLAEFLKAAGIPSQAEDSAFIAETYEGPIPAKALESGLQNVRTRFPLRDIRLYLEVVFSQDAPSSKNMWTHLAPILDTLRQEAATPPRPETPSPTPPTIPDIPLGLTVLDKLFIDAIVSSANGIIGAPGVDDLRAILSEFDSLNHHRHQSRYHLGLFDALFDHPFAPEQNGDNPPRRAWYLAGFVTGLARRKEGTRDKLLQTVKDHLDILRFVASSPLPCGSILLRHTYPLLIDLGELSVLSSLIHQHILSLSKDWFDIQSFAEELLAAASDLIRNNKPKESLAILEPLLGRIQPFIRRSFGQPLTEDEVEILMDIPPYFVAGFERRLLRKTANAYQSLGQFEKAAETLRQVVELDSSSEEAAAALADLGLIQGGFRSLFDTLPTTADAAKTIHDALKRGLDEFHKASQAERGNQNAHICLGIHAALGTPPRPEEAAHHFELALAGMAGNPGYEVRNLVGWIRLLYGLSLLEAADWTSLHKAQESLSTATATPADFPFFLWERCIKAASVFDDLSLATSLAETLLKTSRHRNATLKLITKEPHLLATSPDIRRAFLDYLTKDQLTDDERWCGLELLLDASRKAEDFDTAGHTLDTMESLASTHRQFAEPFLDILRTPARYQPVWDFEDAQTAIVNLFGFLERKTEALELLKQRVYSLINSARPWDFDQAEKLVDTIRDLGADEETYVNLLKTVESRKPAITPADTDPADQRLRNGERVTLAFVGGNETQSQYENEIRREILKDYPGLDLHFFFSAYESNWGLYYDKVRSLKPYLDGIIISRWARTELGRKLRLLCDDTCLRFDSYTKGKKSIEDTIRRAALTVVTQRMRQNRTQGPRP